MLFARKYAYRLFTIQCLNVNVLLKKRCLLFVYYPVDFYLMLFVKNDANRLFTIQWFIGHIFCKAWNRTLGLANDTDKQRLRGSQSLATLITVYGHK